MVILPRVLLKLADMTCGDGPGPVDLDLIEAVDGSVDLHISDSEWAVARLGRDEALALSAALAEWAEGWPCPNPEDPEGCYCPGDGPCVTSASTSD